jgi:hypothetical protein
VVDDDDNVKVHMIFDTGIRANDSDPDDNEGSERVMMSHMIETTILVSVTKKWTHTKRHDSRCL